MELVDAIKHAIDGNALLFIGSGFSIGALPLKGESFMTGRQLANYLYKECRIDPPDSELNYAAQRYRKKFGDRKLVDELQHLFAAAEVHPNHERFSEINWKAIYTTNYDDVLEKAFAARKKRLTPVTPNMDTKDYTSRRNICIHINGYIDTLTTESLNDSFKLTNTSYLTELFSKTNWAFLFRRTLETCSAVIFIGYSLYDIDIQRILFADDSLKAKTIFVEKEGKSLSDFEDSIQADFGTICPIGINGFWTYYDEVRKEYQPSNTESSLFAFEEITGPNTTNDLRDDDAFNLLLKGEYKIEYIWNSVHNSTCNKYFIVRNHHGFALNQINIGKRNIIVHSDIANGKTLFLLGLACQLISKGYRIFWLRDDVDNAVSEINYISTLETPTVFIVENYPRRLSEIKYINLKRSESSILLISAKTALHEMACDELSKSIDATSTIDIDLNKLSNDEVAELSSILTTYKLWGEHDGWGENQKIGFLKKDCEQEFNAALLEIVKAPEIQRRFNILFDSFRQNNSLTDVIVAASILKLLGFNKPSENMISELIDSNYLSTLEFKRNPIIKQLLTFSGSGIIPRSSIIARYGLTTFSDSRTLVDRLIKIATNAHNCGQSNNSLYFGIYRDLVNYSTLQSILPKRGMRDAVIRFYEKIKNLRAAQNHPHFLLQYAIARLSYDEPEDLEKAKFFLDSAYAQAQRRDNYHTRHMDNVKARYLIKHAITISEANIAMEEFLSAHAILLKEARTEQTSASYKVAQNYLLFYNKKKRYLSSKQLNQLKNSSIEIIGYIDKLDKDIKVDRHIKACKDNLESLIKDINSDTHE